MYKRPWEIPGSVSLRASCIWGLLGPELRSTKGQRTENFENHHGMEGRWSVSGSRTKWPDRIVANPDLWWPRKQKGHHWASAMQASDSVVWESDLLSPEHQEGSRRKPPLESHRVPIS